MLILASMIGGACVRTWQELLACRVILGIGMGTKASVVPVFAAEISPAHIRGSLVMNWQLFDALGIFLGSTANLSVSGVGPTAWRWQTASSIFPTIVLLTLVFVCSDSPRFLMKRGPKMYKEAYKTLLALRGHPILAAKELLYVHYQMDVEKRFISGKLTDTEMGQSYAGPLEHEAKDRMRTRVLQRFDSTRSVNINYWQKLGQLFTNKRIRRAMGAAVVCMISQQLCGKSQQIPTTHLYLIFSQESMCWLFTRQICSVIRPRTKPPEKLLGLRPNHRTIFGLSFSAGESA
jgi:MFS family permease